MSHLLRGLAVLSGLLPASAALAAMVGLGVVREGQPWVISAASVGVALLPVAGLAGLLRFRPEALALALWTWPLALLLGLPLYFPGERAGALSTGYMWLGALGGERGAAAGAAVGAQVAALLGSERLSGSPPARSITPESVDAPGPVDVPEVGPVAAPSGPESIGASGLSGDEVVLPYEGEGRSLRIPVGFERGDGEAEELWMLFDTGATFTTLDRASLRRLGVQVPRDAPEVTLQTAGGSRAARLVLLDRIWLGGFPVDGVTVAVCEPCASEGVAGLLGLNVSGQLQVTLDHDRGEMVLKPRSSGADRHLDIDQWLAVDTQLTAWSDGRMELTVTAANASERTIDEARVAIECPEDRFAVALSHIPGRGGATEEVSLPRGTSCPEYRVSLDYARW